MYKTRLKEKYSVQKVIYIYIYDMILYFVCVYQDFQWLHNLRQWDKQKPNKTETQ